MQYLNVTITAILVAAALMGCVSKNGASESGKLPLTMPAAYSGIIPCADCEGIRMDLALQSDNTFLLRQTYLGVEGGQNRTFEESGHWNISSDSQTLTLESDASEPRHFAIKGERTLRMLDREGKEIQSQLNYDLTRAGLGDLSQYSLEMKRVDSSTELTNTYWKLTELNSKAATVFPGQREPHFILSAAENKVNGFGGCNRFFGSYRAEGDSLRFSQMGATRMACPEGMEQEQAFLKALESTDNYKIAGETLELYSDGKLLARFEAVYF
jgi:heat shock protein HslJ